jgi:hypothetical protein
MFTQVVMIPKIYLYSLKSSYILINGYLIYSLFVLKLNISFFDDGSINQN